MKVAIQICAAVLAVLGAASAFAQAPPVAVEPGLSSLAVAVAPARGGTKLAVSTPSFSAGADIPFEYTTYRTNLFPGLTWSAGPAGAQSYAVVLQDGDFLSAGAPYLHWGMFNIPPGTTSLGAGPTNPLPGGASNLRGRAYSGPSTPAGPKHRYHFQVFALDTRLSLDPTAATYDQLIAAMKDHVLASGELVALGQIDPTAPPRGAGGAGRGGAPGAAPGGPAGPPGAAPSAGRPGG